MVRAREDLLAIHIDKGEGEVGAFGGGYQHIEDVPGGIRIDGDVVFLNEAGNSGGVEESNGVGGADAQVILAAGRGGLEFDWANHVVVNT